jgi:hypothetical protein
MLAVTVYTHAKDEDDMAELLRRIADQVEEGMTSGHYPSWELIEVEEEV